MPRYDLLDETGILVQSLICSADQIEAFLQPGQTAVQTSPHDVLDATALRLLRRERDRLLTETDWVEVAVLPVTTLQEMQVWRDRLRDVTETMVGPHEAKLPQQEKVAAIDVSTLSERTWHNLINRERDRRIAERFFFRGQHFDFDAVSKARITGAATLAGFALAGGAGPESLIWHGGNEPFVWIAGDNSTVPMTAPICFAFGQAAAAHEAAHVFAAKAIKDSEKRPADWFDDRHWPGAADLGP